MKSHQIVGFAEGAFSTLKDKTKVINVLHVYFVHNTQLWKSEDNPMFKIDKFF